MANQTNDTPPRAARTVALYEVQYERCVFKLEVLVCPHCQGPCRVIAMITQADVIEKILHCLGLPPEPPMIQQARPPPAEFLL